MSTNQTSLYRKFLNLFKKKPSAGQSASGLVAAPFSPTKALVFVAGFALVGFVVVRSLAASLPLPTLLQPLNNTTTSTTPTFKWSSVATATTYRINVTKSTDTGFAAPVVDQFVSVPNYTITTPLAAGKYIWRVRAKTSSSRSNWTTPFTFSVGTVSSGFSDNFSSYPLASCFPESSSFGQWTVTFNGFGCTQVVSKNGATWLSESPKVSTASTETHAALTLGPNFSGSLDYKVRLQTAQQLRTGSTPNSWEVGWVVWNYSDPTHFYSLVLKPNGWELNKEDPAYPGNQRFLATGANPTFAIGSTNDVEIIQGTDNKITVKINGAVITTFTDTQTPYTAGKIGLYTEDATALFTNVSASAAVTQPPTSCGATSNFTPAGMRAIPCALYGVTVDDVSNISNIVASSRAFRHMPTTRIVFDPNTQAPDYNASDYQQAITQIKPYSFLMGELLDSGEEKAMPANAEQLRVARFLDLYKNDIDIWEIGNEVNGNWTGNYTDVSAKLVNRYNQVTAAGKRSALTLYENSWAPDHCNDGTNEPTPVQFSQQYVPASVRNGLHYVLLSWYPSQCTTLKDSSGNHIDTVPVATIKAEVEALHALYPNALIGFGELGLPRRASDTTLARLQSIIAYYYALAPQINLPYYMSGYFYWYYYEDALPYTTKPIWQNLNTAFGLY